ncbi:hypothetical protein ABTW96_20575 [Nocardia beijingensis]|uniref:hypothetical protein n=1 Tax=Nocardia beijingensis TaxID=95162 RepID=UPI0033169311
MIDVDIAGKSAAGEQCPPGAGQLQQLAPAAMASCSACGVQHGWPAGAVLVQQACKTL